METQKNPDLFCFSVLNLALASPLKDFCNFYVFYFFFNLLRTLHLDILLKQ